MIRGHTSFTSFPQSSSLIRHRAVQHSQCCWKAISRLNARPHQSISNIIVQTSLPIPCPTA